MSFARDLTNVLKVVLRVHISVKSCIVSFINNNVGNLTRVKICAKLECFRLERCYQGIEICNILKQ